MIMYPDTVASLARSICMIGCAGFRLGSPGGASEDTGFSMEEARLLLWYP